MKFSVGTSEMFLEIFGFKNCWF